MTDKPTARLVRMVLPDHECPYGVKAKAMLEEAGFEIEEQILATRAEVDAYLDREGVATTPQIFIDGLKIGGSGALQRHLAERASA